MTEPVLVNQPARGGNSRVIKMAAAGGVLLLALVVGPKLMGGGGGGEEVTFGPPTPTAPSTAAPSKHDDVQTMRASATRDPFAPLIEEAGSGEASTAPAVSAPLPGADPMPFPTFAPIDDSGDSGLTGAPASTTPTTAPPPPPTHRLSLLEVFSDGSGRTAARVRVDDDVMETLVGQDFGGNYRTVSLDRSSGCGVFLYGDRRISLCEGHEAIT
jgi:hypothetical protein